MQSRRVVVDYSRRVRLEEDVLKNAVVIYNQPVNLKGYSGVMHWHSEAQFSLVTKGSVIFQVENQEYEVSQGQGIFINSNCMHQSYPKDEKQDNYYLCIKFVPEMIFGQLDANAKANYVDAIVHNRGLYAVQFTEGEDAKEISDMLQELAKIYAEKQQGHILNIHILMMQLWKKLFDTVSPSLEHVIGSSCADMQRAEILEAYIRENYAEKITLEDIARAAHISRGECCRIFKRLHKTTPFQYLIRFRLNMSLLLLCDSDYSIAQIAQQVGFGSSSYYTECFKKEMHCTPLKYRQNYQNSAHRIHFVM